MFFTKSLALFKKRALFKPKKVIYRSCRRGAVKASDASFFGDPRACVLDAVAAGSKKSCSFFGAEPAWRCQYAKARSLRQSAKKKALPDGKNRKKEAVLFLEHQK